MRPLKSGESSKRDWLLLNGLNTEQQGTQGRVVDLQARVAGMRPRMESRGRFFPFCIYQVYSEPMAPSTDWLLYRVRAGRVMGVDATGTDGINGDPDEEDLLDAGAAANITVPDATAKFWFWLEVAADQSSAVVRYGDVPTATRYPAGGTALWTSTNAWASAPVPDSQHVPIGWLDTLTQLADKVAIPRQLLRADVVQVGGGGGKLTCCQITTIPASNKDYVGVKLWDGTTQTGAEFNVAKGVEFRPSIASEVDDGVTVGFTYTNDNQRTSSDGTHSQVEVVYPRYAVGKVLWVSQADHTMVTVSGAELGWLEVRPCRFWLRRDPSS